MFYSQICPILYVDTNGNCFKEFTAQLDQITHKKDTEDYSMISFLFTSNFDQHDFLNQFVKVWIKCE